MLIYILISVSSADAASITHVVLCKTSVGWSGLPPSYEEILSLTKSKYLSFKLLSKLSVKLCYTF